METNNIFITNGSKVFFTSDTHFNHVNILRYTNRKNHYSTIQEMNNDFIRRWNEKVPKDGIVFHLGDVGFFNNDADNILDKLNGKIYLVMGNHDRKNIKEKDKKRFMFVTQQLFITVEKQKIYLNHFPFLCMDGVFNNLGRVWQLFGHIHSEKHGEWIGCDKPRIESMQLPIQYDVGVDNNDYAPISFYEVKAIINKAIINKKIEDFKNEK